MDERCVNIKKAGQRVIDTTTDDQQMICDVNGPDTDAVLQQVIHSNSFTKRYSRQTDSLQDLSHTIPEADELRVVRQPQLKVEALWLHRKGDSPTFSYQCEVSEI
ncbi:hypothetical protein BC343_13970 [Mucilaginibacter pedocola]|uniref:Uncharacterized protein n=1 Tax=Mucilaginibacter pedocola TaxID=1792845 RepID=A0A1S9PAM8_9SPHI|nr:hypothetical protein BC343_13970 [Mucilaginibacter pedocola]